MAPPTLRPVRSLSSPHCGHSMMAMTPFLPPDGYSSASPSTGPEQTGATVVVERLIRLACYRRAAMWFVLAVSVVVVAYNNVVNRWRPFHGAAYVPLNTVFAGTITLLAAAVLGLSAAELGFDGDAAGATSALGIVVLFALAVVILARSRHGHRLTDARVIDLRGPALIFYVLVRIPLGTAVTEEVVFRGVLFAAWRDAGVSSVVAAVCTSVAFGLWHVAPTIIGIRVNHLDTSRRTIRIVVIGAVLFTFSAGMGLTWLRVATGGLVAPIVLHAGINSASALAAVLAGRRRGRSSAAPTH